MIEFIVTFLAAFVSIIILVPAMLGIFMNKDFITTFRNNWKELVFSGFIVGLLSGFTAFI